MRRTSLFFAALLCWAQICAPTVHAATRNVGADNIRPDNQPATVNNRDTTISRSTIPRSATTTPRTTTSNIVSRSAITQPRVVATPGRQSSVVSRVGADNIRPSTADRGATIQPRATQINNQQSAIRNQKSAISNRTRAATITAQSTAALTDNYKNCRSVYYNCMDEFCAAKDTQLKRCACSSRVNDFNTVRENMSRVENSLLDFNERLLTVNMDAEDAAAISIATEGELAFQQEDKSDSKKILDEIANKLKSVQDIDDEMARNMSAISLPFDTSMAFDNIDSFFGTQTAAKEGVELYAAATPVCREMAMEVCDNDGVEIAISGYQMMIAQDCNTVENAYATMQDQALERVREGSALLDISRLDTYQKRNADDILTCKRKMLDTLASASVCGDNLGKCLDTTGRYIDPSTGEAFLTSNLSDLATLITRPSGDEKWSTNSGNKQFVAFLNSKKLYLESATDNCEVIAPQVWNDFIEDALAQIKLAQDAKLEQMRQSCTSLTTTCLADANASIADFDARALSVFGVSADRTANLMCANIKNACSALLDTQSDGDDGWDTGVTDIATEKTFATILSTCTEVGKNCIIRRCTSVSGNFGLCMNRDSQSRRDILNRVSCWNEVESCVANAGADTIEKIMELTVGGIDKDFYATMYGTAQLTESNTISDPTSCFGTGGTGENAPMCLFNPCLNSANIATCRITERIWGNCELGSINNPNQQAHNKILIPVDGISTLMYWFANNTGTTQLLNSCVAACASGQILSKGICVIANDPNATPTGCEPGEDITNDCAACPPGKYCAGGTMRPQTCPVGQYSTGGAVQCAQCPGNQFTNGTGSTSPNACTCDTKQYPDAGGTCQTCPAGSSCDGKTATVCGVNSYAQLGAGTCTSCIGTQTTNGATGSTSATACVCTPGEYVVWNGCQTCPAGYFCADGRTQKQCQPGTYSEGGAASCDTCPSATPNSPYGANSSSECTVCTHRQYTEDDGVTCKDCPANHECDGEIATPCPTGWYVNQQGDCQNLFIQM